MNRKPTKNTRGPNADEKRFQAWLKEQPCCVTDKPGPSIVHHCEGATFKHNKVLVGHWFCIPLSQEVDDIVTHGSRKAFRERYGSQAGLWEDIYYDYLIEKNIDKACSDEVWRAILNWGK